MNHEKAPTPHVEIVRTLEGLIHAAAIRAMVFGAEQKCPLTEEFDGNDFAGVTHMLVKYGAEPVGALRLRWFADFAKMERVAVVAGARSGEAARALIHAAVALSARKGYRLLIGHVESTLVPYWRRVLKVRVRADRPPVRFSDRDYIEIELAITPPPEPITTGTPALVMLRPEGQWDAPGILDGSNAREKAKDAAWKR